MHGPEELHRLANERQGPRKCVVRGADHLQLGGLRQGLGGFQELKQRRHRGYDAKQVTASPAQLPEIQHHGAGPDPDRLKLPKLLVDLVTGLQPPATNKLEL